MAEQIDIFDANLSPIGSMEIREAHLRGEWHRAFHCWVVSAEGGGSLLLQQRHAEVVAYPNCLDVSAAGHIRTGEEVEDGVREVVEELGIEVKRADLHELGYRVEVADLPNGIRNREYQFVSLLRCDLPLSAYRPQVEEVAALYWIGLGDALELFSGRVAEARVRGIAHEGGWRPRERTIALGDFVARVQKYYLTVAIMAERLLDGRGPLAIS